MNNPLQVLEKYWGHSAFRPLQEDIIHAVLNGDNTLAILPTGGGKSICFQVPAMMLDGVCIVVSPLIALMKDQVENLKVRNIRAGCATSDLNWHELDALFDRAVHGDLKFLYLSPERLKTELAVERIKKMKVALFAIDEAHCISEWGYDFRPAYLEIAEIKTFHPNTPVIALTASATPKVAADILDKLKTPKAKVFNSGFERPNLAYHVRFTEDKIGRLVQLCAHFNRTGIVYVRSRKGTEKIAKTLAQKGVSADYYHAGLSAEQRDQKQKAWRNNQCKVMVATNAFGMGIDKPDVRFVVHLDLPETVENYYQECGRGGRDGKKAFAVALLDSEDCRRLLDKTAATFPSKADIAKTYQSLCAYLKLAVGSGKEEAFRVDFDALCAQYDLKPVTVHHALGFLEKEGYLSVSQYADRHSKFMFTSSSAELHALKLKNPKIEVLLNALMRSYTGMFENMTSISEKVVATRARWPLKNVKNGLTFLKDRGYAEYVASSELPTVTLLTERIQPKNFVISKEHYEQRKRIVLDKALAMHHYATTENKCRSRMILEYFGDDDAKACGICDYCSQQPKSENTIIDFSGDSVVPLKSSKASAVKNTRVRKSKTDGLGSK